MEGFLTKIDSHQSYYFLSKLFLMNFLINIIIVSFLIKFFFLSMCLTKVDLNCMVILIKFRSLLIFRKTILKPIFFFHPLLTKIFLLSLILEHLWRKVSIFSISGENVYSIFFQSFFIFTDEIIL